MKLQVTGKITPSAEIVKLLNRRYLFNVPDYHLEYTQAAGPATRKNQNALSDPEKTAFINAYKAMNTGPLGVIVAMHADMNYLMHGFLGEYGVQRFLPWHRSYLYYFEKILQIVVNNYNITIPYWDWSNPKDQSIPTWLQNFTPTIYGASTPNITFPLTVFRQPGLIAESLPPPEDVTTLMSKTQYGNGLSNVGFTICLEAGNGAPGEFPEFKSEMHNQVHNWVGGTMADISTAAADPIFWMHHANVDRIWSEWQNKYNNINVQNPNLGCYSDPKQACDPWIPPGRTAPLWDLDPFNMTEPQTRNILNLGYTYT